MRSGQGYITRGSYQIYFLGLHGVHLLTLVDSMGDIESKLYSYFPVFSLKQCFTSIAGHIHMSRDIKTVSNKLNTSNGKKPSRDDIKKCQRCACALLLHGGGGAYLKPWNIFTLGFQVQMKFCLVDI